MAGRFERHREKGALTPPEGTGDISRAFPPVKPVTAPLNRILVAAAILLTGLASTEVAVAQRPGDAFQPESAPISNIVYKVSIDPASARARQVHVAMSFRTASADPVVLSLPVWTPGAYEVSYFARWVTGVTATGDGAPLAWEKTDYDTWRFRTNGAREVTVSFDYRADTLDNAMAWSRPDFLLFNGTNFFMYPQGRGFDFPATVKIEAPNDWRVATGMSPGTESGTFGASNYHDLVDMPFFLGKFDLDSARAGLGWLRFASYPAGTMSKEQTATTMTALTKVIAVESAVFGETPWKTYTVMQIADSSYGGISGLEHQNSHVDVTTPLAIGQPIMMSIYAHEIFHAWNVKRLRPADLWPYQYAHEQPTPWLWVSEGITDYYADLAEVRSGAVDSAGFFELTAGKMTEIANLRPVALHDASLSAWIHVVDGTDDSYYPKGSLAGLMLDIVIRDASDNKVSLDDVMRRLYEDAYKKGRGFTPEQWWGAVSAAAGGRSFADFGAKYVDGRDPYPWSSLLPLAGFKQTVDTTRTPTLGITTTLDSSGIVVSSVVAGSMAAEAGVQPGDRLEAVGDVQVSDRSFVTRFREKYKTAGMSVPLTVRRGSSSVVLPASLHLDERIAIKVSADPKATPKAARIRAGILHGTVGGAR